MRAAVARRDEPCDKISFELFVTELVGALATLLPECASQRARAAAFGRGSANVELSIQRASFATVVFRQGCQRVLAGSVPLSAAGLNDLGADLVGFFCGASLTTLALYPRTEPVCKPRTRPRRRGPYDAPLIPLPFEPPIKLRL